MKYYAGIGSRKTPADVLLRMKVYARQLEAGYGVPVYDLADVNNTFENDWLS